MVMNIQETADITLRNLLDYTWDHLKFNNDYNDYDELKKHLKI